MNRERVMIGDESDLYRWLSMLDMVGIGET